MHRDGLEHNHPKNSVLCGEPYQSQSSSGISCRGILEGDDDLMMCCVVSRMVSVVRGWHSSFVTPQLSTRLSEYARRGINMDLPKEPESLTHEIVKQSIKFYKLGKNGEACPPSYRWAYDRLQDCPLISLRFHSQVTPSFLGSK